MAINQGWCIEAICDRCTFTEFVPYSARAEAEELLRQRGWRVTQERTICKYCAQVEDRAEDARRRDEERRRRRRPWPKL